ncbi:MAG: hypothetical protein KAG96_06160 [Ichthyobacteriaceae bacterium]|nr:hypothetical protein [Ichthyobacteriaceae bacterium]
MKNTSNTINSSNNKYKPGIFRYCDRWCEKCDHTNECLFFEINNKLESEERLKESFWNNMESIVNITINDLQDLAQDLGIEFATKTEKASHSQKCELTHGYLLYEKTTTYSRIVNDWFDDFSSKPLAINKSDISKGMSVKELAEGMKKLQKAVEYIRWYQDFISLKLKKALYSKHQFEDGFHRGFAKVVLIALDTSIESWNKIVGHFPSTANKVSNQIMLLEKIKEEVEKEFPYARKYKRQGLD